MSLNLDPTLPAAFVEMGDGGAHDPQLRVTAPDSSVIWNGFKVCICAQPWATYVPAAITGTSQLLSFTTTAGAGGSSPSDSQWPFALIYDYKLAKLGGYQLQARVQFHAAGGTSVGSLAVGPLAACTGAQPGPIFGDYDSDWFNIGCGNPTCVSPEVFALHTIYTNFSPLGGTVTITNGHLDLRWVSGAGTPPDWLPCQAFGITYYPPGHPQAGLYINLATSNVGVLTKTYTQVRDAINALGVGLVAAVQHSGGSDIVVPDVGCDCASTPGCCCCLMSGAIASGGIHDKAGLPL